MIDYRLAYEINCQHFKEISNLIAGEYVVDFICELSSSQIDLYQCKTCLDRIEVMDTDDIEKDSKLIFGYRRF